MSAKQINKMPATMTHTVSRVLRNLERRRARQAKILLRKIDKNGKVINGRFVVNGLTDVQHYVLSCAYRQETSK